MPSVPSTIHLPALARNISPSLPAITYHLFFITGNPGLIAYYTYFLQNLHVELNASWALKQHNANLAVYGRSLSGFEVDDGTDENSKSSSHNEPLSLQQEIDFVEHTLRDYITSLSPPSPTGSVEQAKQKHKIILLGHSVGSYILLSLLSSHLTTPSSLLPPTTSATTTIEAGICLFPTIVDIAASPSGVKLAWLSRRIPTLPSLAAGAVRLLLTVLGARLFSWVVGVVTGMQKASARVTVAFLRSRGGVSQALHMANDELQTITTDKWDSRIWGAATAPSSSSSSSSSSTSSPNNPTHHPPPKLFFYFGRNDHWVAERTRDDLIAARGRRRREHDVADGGGEREEEAWKPWMEIDGNGVPHGFCLTEGHSAVVAMKCREFVENVVTGSSM